MCACACVCACVCVCRLLYLLQQSSSSLELRTECAVVLGSLSMGTENNIKSLVDCHIIPALLQGSCFVYSVHLLYYCFNYISDQINAALMRIRDVFQNKNHDNKLLTGVMCFCRSFMFWADLHWGMSTLFKNRLHQSSHTSAAALHSKITCTFWKDVCTCINRSVINMF